MDNGRTFHYREQRQVLKLTWIGQQTVGYRGPAEQRERNVVHAK